MNLNFFILMFMAFVSYKYIDIPRKNKVIFYNKIMVNDVYNNNNEVNDYLKRLNSLEIDAKCNNKWDVENRKEKIKKLRNFYINSALNFTVDEMNLINNKIREVYGKVNEFNKKYNLNFRIKYNWKFIKLRNDIDWGYPYTISDFIVLSDKILFKNNRKLAETLLHEMIHIIQRKNKEFFDDFYVKVFKLIPSKNLIDNTLYKKLEITNPDGYDTYWIYPYNGMYIYPILILDNDLYSHKSLGLILIKNGLEFEKIYIKSSNECKTFDINDKKFVKKYYNIRQLYHPNEIFANLLARHIIGNVNFENNKLKKNLGILFNKIS